MKRKVKGGRKQRRSNDCDKVDEKLHENKRGEPYFANKIEIW